MVTILKRNRRNSVRKLVGGELRVNLPQYAVGALLANVGPLSQKAVSERLAIDPSDLVSQIDEMERAGLVIRTRDMADRRRYHLGLTRAGQRYVEEAGQKVKETIGDFLSPLTEQEQAEFMHLLRKLFEHDR